MNKIKMFFAVLVFAGLFFAAQSAVAEENPAFAQLASILNQIAAVIQDIAEEVREIIKAEPTRTPTPASPPSVVAPVSPPAPAPASITPIVPVAPVSPPLGVPVPPPTPAVTPTSRQVQIMPRVIQSSPQSQPTAAPTISRQIQEIQRRIDELKNRILSPSAENPTETVKVSDDLELLIYRSGNRTVALPRIVTAPKRTVPTSSQQLTAPAPPSIAVAPLEEQCSIPFFIDPNTQTNIAQTFPDLGGNFIVWLQLSSSGSGPYILRGYYLGSDGLLGTGDDSGPINLTNVQLTGFSSGDINPRVNSNGLVAFMRTVPATGTTGAFNTQLVTCNFFNCQSTISVITSTPSVALGFFQVSPINLAFDINANRLAYAKSDNSSVVVGGINEVRGRDLTTGVEQIIMQTPSGPYPILNYFRDVFFDNTGLISWTEISVTVTSPFPYINYYDYYINLPSTINPILVNSASSTNPGNPPIAGIISSRIAYNQGGVALSFYPVIENNLLDLDIHYKGYAAGVFSAPNAVISNDSLTQRFPRMAISPLGSLLAFDENPWVLPSPISRIRLMSYVLPSNSFVDQQMILPPAGWNYIGYPEVNGNVVVAIASGHQNATNMGSRIVISDCRATPNLPNPFLPPNTPSNLTAVWTPGGVQLNWQDNSNNESGFKLERSLNNVVYFETLLPANQTSYLDTNVTPNTTYWYRVRAYNVFGNSGYTNTVTLTTPNIMPPAAPLNLIGSAPASNQVDLIWQDNSNNENGFKVERSWDGVNFFLAGTTPANQNTFSDLFLSPFTTYWYRVYAYNLAGNSAYSNIFQITTPGTGSTPPNAPSNLTAAATTTAAVGLNWQDNSTNENGFNIERSLNGSFFNPLATTSLNTTSYSDWNVFSGTTYWYRARAFNGAGYSPYSNVANTTVP